AESEQVSPMREPVDSQVLAHVIKIHVAGTHDRVVEGDAAVAVLAPAVVFASPEPDTATAAVDGVFVQGAFLQARNGIENFEGGAGRVGSLSNAILQRVVRVAHERAPICRLDARPEDVGIKRWV